MESQLKVFKNIFGVFYSYYIQHSFICRPSDSTVPTDAGNRSNPVPLQLAHWQLKVATRPVPSSFSQALKDNVGVWI
jgi:hypothetical protein